MTIEALLSEDAVEFGKYISSKREAIQTLAGLQKRAGNVSDEKELIRSVMEREEKGSTALSGGIAIAYGRSKGVKEVMLSAVVSPEGVDYDSLDEKPSNILFLLAMPEDYKEHLEIMLRIINVFDSLKFFRECLEAGSAEKFVKLVVEAEKAKYGEA